MKKNDFKDKTPQELIDSVAALKIEQGASRFGRVGGKMTSLKEYRKNKKAIAQMLTILNTK